MTNAPGSSTTRRGRQLTFGSTVQHRLFRLEMTAHRLDTFLPGVVVQNEIAESRMTFEAETKQVLGLPFVPVRRMHKFDNAGKNLLIQRGVHEHMNPPGFAVSVKTIAQLPFVGGFLDHQAQRN